MGKYKIAGINIEFNYCFDKFFKDQIDNYQIDENEEVKCKMYVYLHDEIKEEYQNGQIFKNRKIYHTLDKEIVDVYDKEWTRIHARIICNTDYTYTEIHFCTSLGTKLPEYEYTLTGMYFLSMVTHLGIIPIHASAISYKNEAILFSAPSTTGKSTHARLWKKVFEEVKYINDDKPLLYLQDDKFYVLGSPWSGKDSVNENIRVPLKCIFFLHQSPDNFVIEMNNKDKLTYLMRNIHRPYEDKAIQKVLTNLNELIDKVPMYILNCNMNDEAVYTAYRKLYEEEANEN